MFNPEHVDALLTVALSSPSTASSQNFSACLDLAEAGGADHARLLIACEAPDKQVTLSLYGADDEAGRGSVCLNSWKLQAGKPFELRERLPLACKRYAKLAFSTGSALPSAPVTATLRIML